MNKIDFEPAPMEQFLADVKVARGDVDDGSFNAFDNRINAMRQLILDEKRLALIDKVVEAVGSEERLLPGGHAILDIIDGQVSGGRL